MIHVAPLCIFLPRYAFIALALFGIFIFFFFCKKKTLPNKHFPHSTRLLHRTAFLTLTEIPKTLDGFVMLKTLSEVTQLVSCIV